jgi:hypothetical protein
MVLTPCYTLLIMDEEKDYQVFEIRVKAKNKLTEDEMWACATDFMHRLSGYTTVCPEELRGADISLVPMKP